MSNCIVKVQTLLFLFHFQILGQTMEQEDESRMYSRESLTEIPSNYRPGSVAY